MANFGLQEFSTQEAVNFEAYTDWNWEVLNLATQEVNINLNTSTGIQADAGIASAGSATEILGAGVANTDSSDSTSASDISMGTSASDEKEVWICNDQIINGAADQYIYVCNAGSGNGTTNSTAGTLSIIIEYYGID